MIVLDTNVLIFDALFPEKITAKAKKILDSDEDFACADISLWEIAMLIIKKRIEVQCETEQFINDILLARKIEVLPITSEIAVLSQSLGIEHKDPADLLIAATAIYHEISLVSSDKIFKKIEGLRCIW